MDSLCARVLRAKDYPIGRMEDTFSQIIPLHHGNALLMVLIVEEMAFGTQVHITDGSQENLLPKLFLERGVIAWNGALELLNVHMNWDSVLVKNNFPLDSDAILKITTLTHNQEDLLAWLGEPLSIFQLSVDVYYTTFFL